MSEKQITQNPKPASVPTEASKPDTNKVEDHGQAAIQAAWDDANDKGYWGSVPDETPNDAYTVAGVTKKAKGDK